MGWCGNIGRRSVSLRTSIVKRARTHSDPIKVWPGQPFISIGIGAGAGHGA